MELHFIINERAGNGRSKKIWNRFKKELTINYFQHYTLSRGHASQLAKKIAQNTINEQVLIVAVGGDGTIHEVINGVKGYRNVIVGFVKAGSGNDFSRGYFSFDTASLINELMSKDSFLVDLKDYGVVKIDEHEENVFVNNSGIGFDAFVAYKTNQSKIKKILNKMGLGKLSYIYYLLLSLLTFQLFELTVELDGVQKKYKNVWMATVSNQPYFGGGMKISPNSKPDDGLLELTIVHNLSRLKLLFLFMTVFFGTHTKMREVKQIANDRFTLCMNNNLLCHADGEHVGNIKPNSIVTYSIEPQGFQLAKPK